MSALRSFILVCILAVASAFTITVPPGKVRADGRMICFRSRIGF